MRPVSSLHTRVAVAVAVAACALSALVAAPVASAASTWLVSNSPSGGTSFSFGFGQPGDVFLSGDWNGDGSDTPGVYRRRAGTSALWILSNSTTGAGPLISFAFGASDTDFPVVGDWFHNGSDTAGVLRPDPGGGPNTYFLAHADVDGGGNPLTFTYGNLGDRPIAGDWNNDGTDTIGVYRVPMTGPQFIEADANQTITGGTTVDFGDLGDTPLAGDWNGDGIDTPGVFRAVAAVGRWGFLTANASGSLVDGFGYGNADDTPVVGDWDANGTDTAALVRPNLEFVPGAVVPATPGAPGAPGAPAAPVAVGTPNGQNASRAAKLTVAYSGTTKRSRRLGFSSRPTITGRLVDGNGAGIGGAAVVVLSRPRQFRAATSPIDTLTTGADGAISYKLPSGPSRTITFAYTAFAGDTHPAVTSAALRTVVPARLTARPSPSSPRVGERMRVSGTLTFLPRANIEVTIQARQGRRWSTVATAKTRARGRFSWPYRFKPFNRGHTFVFRAHVDSPIYPFTPGNSKAFSVHVR
jgi:hypothetical protein